MRMRVLSTFAAVLISGVILSAPASAHKIDAKDDVYFATPVFTERSWVESEFFLNFDLRDRDEPSRPNPAVGFYPDLGLEFSLWGLGSIKTHVPLWINNWSEPNNTDAEVDDLFVPNWFLGFKLDVASMLGHAAGDSMPKWFRLALGYEVGIPTNLGVEGHEWSDPDTNSTNDADQGDMVHQARLFAGVTFAKFSLQLETGINYWDIGEDSYVNRYSMPGAIDNTLAYAKRMDVVYNIALPYVFKFEGTVLMLELNGIASQIEGSSLDPQAGTEWKHQLFLTPGVTFAPGSNFTLAFGFQIPLIDDIDNDNFRFLFNCRYAFSIGKVTSPFWIEEEKEGEKGEEKKDETKPAEEKKDEAKPAEEKKDEAKPAEEKKDEAAPAEEKKDEATPPPPAEEKKDEAPPAPPAEETKTEG